MLFSHSQLTLFHLSHPKFASQNILLLQSFLLCGCQFEHCHMAEMQRPGVKSHHTLSLLFCLLICLLCSHCSRCFWPNDRHSEPGEPPVPADLRCGQTAGIYSRHRSCLLDYPHGLQHLVVQTPKEAEWPVQQLCRYTQRSVHECNKFNTHRTINLNFKFKAPVYFSEVFSLHLVSECDAIRSSPSSLP